MKNLSQLYVSQLELLRADLEIAMSMIPTGPVFDSAKPHAEAMVCLLASQLAVLQNAGFPAIHPNLASLMELRAHLDTFIVLLQDPTAKTKFVEYNAMLDSLIEDYDSIA